MLNKIEAHPLFEVKSSTAKGRIRKGHVGYLLHDEEILQIRGINTDYYILPRKVLSNFANFSSFSVSMMDSTSRDWHRSWSEFLLPTYHVVRFVSEGFAGFAEIFPLVACIVSDSERHLIESYRTDLRRKPVKENQK